MIDKQSIINEQYASVCDSRLYEERPSSRIKPRLSIDGNQWCALFGDNIQEGVAGFGNSPNLAYFDFDKQWIKTL